MPKVRFVILKGETSKRSFNLLWQIKICRNDFTMFTIFSLSCAFYWQGWDLFSRMFILGLSTFTIISSLCFLWARNCVLQPCLESNSAPPELSSSSKTKVVESFIGSMCDGLGNLNSSLGDGGSNCKCCKYRCYIWACHTTPNLEGYWN